MRRTVLLLASMASAVLLCSAATGSEQASAQERTSKPNFVFILADDMRYDDLNQRYMPKTMSVLRDRGMRFNKAFVSLPLCCPSRATILTGQYAHNTGVWIDRNKRGVGGWPAFKHHDLEKDNVATRLHAGGYRTGLFGKYLNLYNGSEKPPGWDDWFATFKAGKGTHNAKYYNYDVNDNGTIKHFGDKPSDYNTDVISAQTQDFIDASVRKHKPFLAYVAPKAPHGPYTPAPRDEHTFDGEKAPRLPSFNEKDVSDKPPPIQKLPRLGSRQIAEINKRHEGRVETLQALDDLVKAVANKLSSAGVLNNTYIFFTSDNGYHLGEHRLVKGKFLPYEEDIHMPLMVRGPGVKAGSTTHKLVINTDYFPTFTDLGGIHTPGYVDGRSLRPVLEGSVTGWRSAVLLEEQNIAKSKDAYYGILTSSGSKYIEYNSGFRELYSLSTDRYELRSSYNAGAPPANLVKQLRALKKCAEATCRVAEDGP